MSQIDCRILKSKLILQEQDPTSEIEPETPEAETSIFKMGKVGLDQTWLVGPTEQSMLRVLDFSRISE